MVTALRRQRPWLACYPRLGPRVGQAWACVDTAAAPPFPVTHLPRLWVRDSDSGRGAVRRYPLSRRPFGGHNKFLKPLNRSRFFLSGIGLGVVGAAARVGRWAPESLSCAALQSKLGPSALGGDRGGGEKGKGGAGWVIPERASSRICGQQRCWRQAGPNKNPSAMGGG